MRTAKERIEAAISYVFGGLHNAPIMHLVNSFNLAYEVNTHQDLATFDSNKLTAIVIAAHRYCVRVSVEQSGPGMIKLIFWARNGTEGGFSERHPDLCDLAKTCTRLAVADADEETK